MKYSGMPVAMWFLYRKSFQSALVNDLKRSPEEAKLIMAKVKPKYKEIICKLRGDKLLVCAITDIPVNDSHSNSNQA